MPFRVQYPDSTGPYRIWDEEHQFLFDEHSGPEHPVPEYDGLVRTGGHYFAHPNACSFLDWWGTTLVQVIDMGMEVIHFNAPCEVGDTGKQCMYYPENMEDIKTIIS